MNYKYEDLVVIPKKDLATIACMAEYGFRARAEDLEKQAKPLLPIVESAFDEGFGWITDNAAEKAKQEFITKGIEI